MSETSDTSPEKSDTPLFDSIASDSPEVEIVDPADSQAAVEVPVTTDQIPVGDPEDVPATSANPTADPAQLQFPSLMGASQTEIDERSPDQDGANDDRYIKVYVVQPAIAGWEPPADSDEWHRPNKAAVLNEAVNRGLHPAEEASFDGWENHPDGFNKCLTYSVAVIPAVIDEAPGLAFVPAHSENIDGSYPAGINPAK